MLWHWRGHIISGDRTGHAQPNLFYICLTFDVFVFYVCTVFDMYYYSCLAFDM